MELNDLKIKYKSFSIFEKIIFFNSTIFLLSLAFKSFILDFFQLNSNIENLLLNPWTLVTYSFVHISIWDLFFNMLILFYVSTPLVNIFKNTLPLKIYFYGILIGGLFFVLSSSFLISIDRVYNLIGASAGVRAL